MRDDSPDPLSHAIPLKGSANEGRIQKQHEPTQNPLLVSLEQLIVIFGLYVLSIGPMYWYWVAAKDGNGSKLVEVLYRPLWHLAGAFPPLAEWLNWYLRWWVF